MNFDQTVTVKQKSSVADGKGGFTDTYATLMTISAALRPLSSNEIYSNSRLGVESSFRMYTTAAGIKKDHRVFWNEKVFNVTGEPRNPGLKNHHFEIDLKEI